MHLGHQQAYVACSKDVWTFYCFLNKQRLLGPPPINVNRTAYFLDPPNDHLITHFIGAIFSAHTPYAAADDDGHHAVATFITHDEDDWVGGSDLIIVIIITSARWASLLAAVLHLRKWGQIRQMPKENPPR